jgi:hypothetical protein
MSNKDTISFRVSGPVFAALEKDVDEFNAKNIAEAARARLESTLDSPAPRTAKSELSERKLIAEVTAREIENEKKLGALILRTDALLSLQRKCEPIRQAIMQVANAVDGLTDDQRAQLDKWREDTLTNLSGGEFDFG